MKLSFTTLGCPDWDLATIISKSQDYGFTGIDFRGYQGNMVIYDLPEFTTSIRETAASIADAGLAVSCFSSGVHVLAEDVASSMAELRAYAELCPAFGCNAIRVFGGWPSGSWDSAIELAAERLRGMATVAGGQGAQVLLEIHDAWVNAPHVKAVMEAADMPNLGVTWDLHHSVRAGEQPEETWATLAPWIRYVHWKDATVPNHDLVLPGVGDLPLAECFRLLDEGGFSGWHVLEWEKKHVPHLPEPEEAFPAFVSMMRRFAEQEVQS